MAEDGDRHVLGDPITRLLQSPTGSAPSLEDATPAERLGDGELRRELANLELVAREGEERGVPPGVMEQVHRRLGALRVESARRERPA